VKADAKTVLCGCVAQISCLSIPRESHPVILRDTVAQLKAQAEMALRRCKAMVCCLAKPRHGLLVVLRNAIARVEIAA
jgi:hypothetical protein